MVGYAKEYPAGTYKFWNPKTKRIIVSDSVKWSEFKRWQVNPEMKGIFENVKNETGGGLATHDELGLNEVLKQHQMRLREIKTPHTVMLEDASTPDNTRTPATHPTLTVKEDPTSTQPLRRSARLLAKDSNEDKDAPASAPTQKPVVTDGQSKVTGNTMVEPMMLDDGVAIIENNSEGDTLGAQIHFNLILPSTLIPVNQLRWMKL